MEIKKSTMLWIVIGVMFLLVLWMTFSISPGAVVETAKAASSSASGSGMVGGC